MKEEFVTYEIAKKLKAKGMGNDGNYGYNDKGEICVPVYNLDDDQVKAMCPCPQIHDVLKWLREEKNTHVLVDFVDKSWLFDLRSLRTGFIVEYDTCRYETYEQAAIAGIEYVIDNLI